MDAMSPKRRTLYPPIEPYCDWHARRWRRSQPLLGALRQSRGKPVVFLHGGPGGGSSPRSSPAVRPGQVQDPGVRPARLRQIDALCDLENNTTWHLVEDIEKLRPRLRGSRSGRSSAAAGDRRLRWPTPKNIRSRATELVLRGIFLFDQDEIDWMYKEGGASLIYPDKFEEFSAPIPEAERTDLVEAYRKRLISSDADEQLGQRRLGAHGKRRRDRPAQRRNSGAFHQPRGGGRVARIENHYMANGGWLEEGQLLRERRRSGASPASSCRDATTPAHRPRRRGSPQAGMAGGRAQHRPDAGIYINEPGTTRRPDPRNGQVRRLRSAANEMTEAKDWLGGISAGVSAYSLAVSGRCPITARPSFPAPWSARSMPKASDCVDAPDG